LRHSRYQVGRSRHVAGLTPVKVPTSGGWGGGLRAADKRCMVSICSSLCDFATYIHDQSLSSSSLVSFHYRVMQSDSSIDEERVHDERSPLLAHSEDAQHPPDHRVPASIARRLYLSHFLSTWNSRVFEFGAVLYIATIFPGTLMPMSVYAFVRGLSAIAFAPAVGLYIDTGNRLQVVRVSIGRSYPACFPCQYPY
jgi:hypothetical protein